MNFIDTYWAMWFLACIKISISIADSVRIASIWPHCDLTVEHIVVECGDFAEVRERYYEAESLQQLFQQINVTYVFDFLCEIELFYRI